MQQTQAGRGEPSKSTAVANSSVANPPHGQANAASLQLSGLAAEYGNYDGLGLAELIAKKQISPLELLHAVHERVEVLNPKLNTDPPR